MRSWPLALLLLASCSEEEDLIRFDETFEDFPSRWGISGRVEQVETYHPAEHGLRFLEPTEMSIGVSISTYDDYGDGHWIELSSDCDPNPQVSATPQGDGTFVVTIELVPSAVGGAGEFDRYFASVPPMPDTSTVSVLVLRAPAGPCVIDNLRFVTPTTVEEW